MRGNNYRINKRDVDFVLNEQLEIGELCDLERYKGFCREDFDAALADAIEFSQEILAPLNRAGDQEGVRFDNGEVTVPASFHDAYKRACEGGWLGVSDSPEWGGRGFPGVVATAAFESLGGACVSFVNYLAGGPGVARMIENFGPDYLRNIFCRNLYTGKWGGTMCLTEPQAGTALGDITASAKKDGDTYLITGAKCFITSGAHNLTSNIVHAVLARIEGAPSGTGGLSQFIIPGQWVNKDGTIGDSNNVTCVGVEQKMGIKASATCALHFGENGPCRGYLLGGEENRGTQQMFQLMNEERIASGLIGIALAAAAFESAVHHNRGEIRRRETVLVKDQAPRVSAVKHIDIRRMLLEQKCMVEGMRAFAYRLALYRDLAYEHPDEDKRKWYLGYVELMTPVIKAYCSDIGFDMTSLAMQCYGNQGYSQKYPVEQYCRDARVAMIFEGTNFIQAADLIGRKLRLGGGILAQNFMAHLDEFITGLREHPKLLDLVAKLEAATTTLLETTMKVDGIIMEGDLDYLMSIATRYLHMFGEIIVARELIEQAAIAMEKIGGLDPGSVDYAFYSGKIQSAKFFVNNILPGVEMKARIIANHDRSCVEIPANAFTI